MKTEESPSLLGKLLGARWDGSIKADDGREVASVRPIMPEMALNLDSSSPLVKTLSSWRNQNRSCFFETREVTPESTVHWLRSLASSVDRLFFIAHDLEMRPVAQYGLKRWNQKIVELDSGILGVRDVVPDMYYKLQMRMLGLSRQSLGFEEARARVLADNIPALFLHKRCGLRKIDVLKNYSAGRDVWVMAMDLRKIEFR
ncbi:hypothetical protein ACFO0J_11385 [Castellaniella hirudinis]|uniref:N-acetyltransferase domain-containing protein n=1 Tax=Castellaniella hirudinis TaxID=1144617 RepID=A0ABV8S0N8_9BURK